MTTTYELYTNENGTPKAVEGKAPAILERVEALEETLDKGVVTSVNGNTGDITPEQTGCLPLSGGNITNNLTVQSKNVVRSVNGSTADASGNVTLTKSDITDSLGYTPLQTAPVTSVNGQTGAVTISVPSPKAYVTETWKNGTSWYRKWSDGLIEQYLSYTSTSEVVWAKDITVTLPTSMTTTNYKAVACLQGDQNRLELGLSAHSKTKTTVTFTGNSMSYGFDIYIVGY